MDQVKGLPETRPRAVLQPTLAIFHPILEGNRSAIAQIPKKTFKYGKTERHQLDVYYPLDRSPAEKTPILFYLHGGGFTSGSRNLAQPFDLIYSCLGAYFARQGFITIIPNYRLAPEFRYPEAAQDIVDAISWSLSHSEDVLVSEMTPMPATDSLFMMGHSAGATHAATAIFHPTVLPLNSDLRSRIKGVVLMSGPFHCPYPNPEKESFTAYFETEERARQESPLSLLFSSLQTLSAAALPQILLVEGEYEPAWLVEVGTNYHRLLEWHLQSPVRRIVAQGHNHISLFCALSTGQGEEWAVEATSWIQKLHTGAISVTSASGGKADGADILHDIRGMHNYPCSQCSQTETQSFTIQFGSKVESSQTFTHCPGCGNKWMRAHPRN